MGLMGVGQYLQSKGRAGDSILAHISPREASLLKAHGGMGTRNPKTGLMEFLTAEELNKLLNESLFGSSPEMGIDYGGDYSISTDTTDTTDAYKTSASATNVTDPDLKYTWQSDQDWAVPGLDKNTDYNYSSELGDMSMYQRDETGKPTTSNYKYFSSGDDLYGAGVSKVYQDPTKYYTDMPDAGNYRLVTNADNSVSYIDYTGDSDLYSDDKGIYYTDENGKKTYVNKYDVTGDKVTVGGKTYSVTKGDETKYSNKIATTADLTDPNYTGKYKDLGDNLPDWTDVPNGKGWKYRSVNGEMYYAMPGDDISAEGYTGLSQDQVNNAYTYKGKNYWNMNQDSYEHEKYGTYDPGTYENAAWSYDEETGNYYRPIYDSETGSFTMKRMLRPGEDSGDSGWLLNIGKYVLPTLVNTAMGYGLGSGIVSELAGAASSAGSGGASGAGAGLMSGTGASSLPSFTEGIGSLWDSAKGALSSIPSNVSNAVSNFSLGSLAPSSMKSVLIPAAIGGGLRGIQTDWDLAEMLKGAGYGALAGYGMDRLGALWDYATTPSTTGPDSFSGGGASFEGVDSWTANHPSELLANQGLDTKFGIPVTDGVSYDPTLVTDRPIYAGDNGKFYLDNFDFPNVTEKWITENTPFYATDTPPIQKPIYQGADGKFYLDNWDFPNITEEWITNNTPFYNMNGEWYMDNFDNPNYSPELVEGGGREWMMDNFDNPEYSVEDPFGKNWKIDWDQYNGGPVGLESKGLWDTVSEYLPSSATLGTIAKSIASGLSGSGSGDSGSGAGLGLGDLTEGGLLDLDKIPIPKYLKDKIKKEAAATGKSWQQVLVETMKNQQSYMAHLA